MAEPFISTLPPSRSLLSFTSPSSAARLKKATAFSCGSFRSGYFALYLPVISATVPPPSAQASMSRAPSMFMDTLFLFQLSSEEGIRTSRPLGLRW
ncbi:MAG TPA: hypothetical protein DCZ92_12265 [Elusimicrobia bacterium]|nr:hypothetical protein [Elusimicrobiota bacterium]